jgi:acetyl esterase/lipase
MRILNKSLYDFAKNTNAQVITIDWSAASYDNLFPDPLHDAQWTPAVGKWVADKLEMLGVNPSNITFVGHSHGAYVSYFAAQELKNNFSQPHAIIALDPAANVRFLSGFDESQIVFEDVAETSLAIKASVDPISPIEFGSDARACTAQYSYDVVLPGTVNPFDAHEYPVTIFANLVEAAANNQSTQADGTHMDIRRLLMEHPVTKAPVDHPYNGIITVTIEKKIEGTTSYMDATLATLQ